MLFFPQLGTEITPDNGNNTNNEPETSLRMVEDGMDIINNPINVLNPQTEITPMITSDMDLTHEIFPENYDEVTEINNNQWYLLLNPSTFENEFGQFNELPSETSFNKLKTEPFIK